jgi:acyl-coenzyme A synthetase/AMP-(fatty) acid ligase
VKKLRIGRRRGKGDGLPLSRLEAALYPALADGRWQVPDRFNFARDVVEALAEDPRRRAVTIVGRDGIIEPRTFHVVSGRAARWSSLLRERGVRPGDAVLVLAGTNVDWIEVVVACFKVGAVVVPCSPTLSAETLDVRLERTGADVVVAEREAAAEIERTTNSPVVLFVDDGRRLLEDSPEEAPTHDTSARDIALVLETPGTAGNAKLVGHSHGAVFAARVAAEHWLDAGRGDAVWCPAGPGSSESIWHVLVGPWSRGAELVLQDGIFDPHERLDHIYRLGVTILCQTPAEYAALAELPDLARFRPPQLRRLVSTGEWLDPNVSAVFEESWGLTIHNGYGQAETNIVVANGAEAGYKPGSLGLPLPGHQVAVIDDQGNELPPNVEGELAVRGRPPTLFAGYWESPEQTKAAFRGDWYATGDMATVDEDGFFWFVGRGSDVITSRGERFGPYEAERALRAHRAVAASAVVGVRDLERGGQFVRAFVVLEEGATASEQLEAELRHDVALMLPEHEVPREIEFVEELPMAPGGKLRRLELRERLVVGRPLWELPPTAAAEPEHDPWAGMLDPWPAKSGHTDAPPPAAEAAAESPTAEALPDYIVPPVPEPEPVTDPAPSAAAVPEPLPDYVIEPVVEPEPAPSAGVLPDPDPQPAPPGPLTEPEPIVEPDRDLPTDPVSDPEPVPDLVPDPEPLIDPERDLPSEPAPDDTPAALVEPEPGTAAEPEPVFEPMPTDVWVPVVTEPAPEPEPEPEPDPEPEPEPDPPPAAEAPEPLSTPRPETAAAAEPQPRGEAAQPEQPRGEAAQSEFPDFIVEDEAVTPAPATPAPERTEGASRPRVTAESILNPEPPPGPLPDFIVDPEKEPDEQEMPKLRLSQPTPPPPAPSPTAGADEPSRESLGLPPLTEFPSFPSLEREEKPLAAGMSKPEGDGEVATDAEDEPEEAKRRRGRRRQVEQGRSRRRERSTSEPGDMAESVDWAGLSSRLNAYSLSSEEPPEEPSPGDEPHSEVEPEE